MKKIKNLLLKILSAIGLFFSAVFYVLLQAKKDQKNELEKEHQEEKIKDLESQNETINKINKKYVEEKKEHEELYNEASAGSGIDSYDAGNELLRKLRKEGRTRNNN